tara:strand:- start:3813 stop:4595 length:783 start_codon:yes stop_codon:yes gene_type:complete
MQQEWNERRDTTDRRYSNDRRAGIDRRLGEDRRKTNIPVEIDNRNNLDRRKGTTRRKGTDQRGGLERRLLVPRNDKKIGKVILGGIIMAALALSLLYYDKDIATEALSGTIAGMETQQLKILGGKNTNLKKLLSEGPVLLDFWATWCGPCLKEMVHLQRFHEKYEGYGLTILTVNQDSPKSISKVRSVLKSKKFSFMVALDPNGKIAKRLNAQLMPTTILLDMDGVIRWMHQGYLPGDEIEIESRIQALIGYQEPTPITS